MTATCILELPKSHDISEIGVAASILAVIEGAPAVKPALITKVNPKPARRTLRIIRGLT